ncbi:hypothetical protein AB0B45_32080 [Nonomuraea sp. NPDC049152]|uniref:hypothetical protein n=1 Tax=Nonomuraea sp. NPDC049152 TaxID=3154350 RepID=UPI0034051083
MGTQSAYLGGNPTRHDTVAADPVHLLKFLAEVVPALDQLPSSPGFLWRDGRPGWSVLDRCLTCRTSVVTDVGVTACRRLVPDVWAYADHLREALDELKIG